MTLESAEVEMREGSNIMKQSEFFLCLFFLSLSFLLTKQNSNINSLLNLNHFPVATLLIFFFIGSLNLISTNPMCCVRRNAGMVPQVHLKSTNSVCSFGLH